MEQNNIEKFKKIYLSQKISEKDIQKNWDTISQLLPEQKNYLPKPFHAYRFMFAGLIVSLFFGTIVLAQISGPGDQLYPVKILSDRVMNNFKKPLQNSVEIRSRKVIVAPSPSPVPTLKTDELNNSTKSAEKKIENKTEANENNDKKSNQKTNENSQRSNSVSPSPKNDSNEENEHFERNQNEVKGESVKSQKHREKNSPTNNKSEE